VFAAPRPAKTSVFRALALQGGGAALIDVSAVRTAAQIGAPQEQADRAQQAAGREGVSDVMAYVAEMRRTADVRKNPKAFD
jgi:hypothetical protein